MSNENGGRGAVVADVGVGVGVVAEEDIVVDVGVAVVAGAIFVVGAVVGEGWGRYVGDGADAG